MFDIKNKTKFKEQLNNKLHELAVKAIDAKRQSMQVNKPLAEAMKPGKGRGKIDDLDFAFDGDWEKGLKKHKLKYKPNDKNIVAADQIELTGKKSDIVAYLKSADYDLPQDEIEEFFPELFEGRLNEEITITLFEGKDDKKTFADFDRESDITAVLQKDPKLKKKFGKKVDDIYFDGEDLVFGAKTAIKRALWNPKVTIDSAVKQILKMKYVF